MSRLKRALIEHLVVAVHNLNDCDQLTSEERGLVEEIIDRAQTLEGGADIVEVGTVTRGPYDGPGGY